MLVELSDGDHFDLRIAPVAKQLGDQVKVRLLNEMAGDHPMHHPIHVHGAGRFLVLSRDGVVESNLVWKDTVLVRTGETVDHPVRHHQRRAVDGSLPHRRAPLARNDVQLRGVMKPGPLPAVQVLR